jgi:hypothetical protein
MEGKGNPYFTHVHSFSYKKNMNLKSLLLSHAYILWSMLHVSPWNKFLQQKKELPLFYHPKHFPYFSKGYAKGGLIFKSGFKFLQRRGKDCN